MLNPARRRVFLLALAMLGPGGLYMADAMKPSPEVERLYQLLNGEKPHPLQLENGAKAASNQTKNELVSQLALTYLPPPPGRVLGRIMYIRTDENRSDMTFALIANLRSPDPEARASALYGLQTLGHPALADFALMSLRDDTDLVLTAACYVLVEKAKQDPRLRKLLEEVHALRRKDTQFHQSVSLLEAHGFVRRTP